MFPHSPSNLATIASHTAGYTGDPPADVVGIVFETGRWDAGALAHPP